MAVEHISHNGGLAGLEKRLAAMQARVRVGYIKGVSEPQTEADGIPCAQVAAWNTFGTHNPDGSVHNPERPFMQHGLQMVDRELKDTARAKLAAAVRGEMAPREALGEMGDAGVRGMRQAIDESESWAAPNTADTVNAKSGTKPLVDSGDMERALAWSVD